MKDYFKDYLFTKHILVNDYLEGGRYQMATMISLANELGIKIVNGQELLNEGMIKYASEQLGKHIPDPFYRGFPESVLRLTPKALLIDQLIHYTITYGFNIWDEAGHSIFEDLVDRGLFKEKAQFKEFSVFDEESAEIYLMHCVDDLLASTRPVNDDQMRLICGFITEYNYIPDNIASKNTAIKILLTTRNLLFSRYISLPDVIKFVDELVHYYYRFGDLKKLNLKNQDRKFITKLIRRTVPESYGRLIKALFECDEKRALWCGLLHHIHFKPKTEREKEFVCHIRSNNPNLSVYARMNNLIEREHPYPVEAAEILRNLKGPGAVARNLDYLLSKCDEDEVSEVIDKMKGVNGIVLLQQLYRYHDHSTGNRTFKFVKYNEMRVHAETDKEAARRKTGKVKERYSSIVSSALVDELIDHYSHQLGKVYIDPEMSGIALPIQEATGTTGIGVLPKGSRLPIPNTKKIRAFTYWEKVNDIDLSVLGITKDGRQKEFSWRTMAFKQSGAIVYSGDETSGYNGGSEYFDIDLNAFKQLYPDVVKLIFCDNVYSCSTFNDCFCKAGYMLRDVEDSGEIFEPKTVQTSFRITADSSFAYLFGIDLETNEFVWLNLSRAGGTHVAGTTSMDWLNPYFESASIMNYKTFFELLASKIVDKPEKADVVVSDKTLYLPAGIEVMQIHSYDFEKVLALMNR